MGNKDPTPKADGLRAMREASRGHLQATADEPIFMPRRKITLAEAKEIFPAATPAPTKPARKRKKLKRKTS